jgi:hypothetical protein
MKKVSDICLDTIAQLHIPLPFPCHHSSLSSTRNHLFLQYSRSVFRAGVNTLMVFPVCCALGTGQPKRRATCSHRGSSRGGRKCTGRSIPRKKLLACIKVCGCSDCCHGRGRGRNEEVNLRSRGTRCRPSVRRQSQRRRRRSRRR